MIDNVFSQDCWNNTIIANLIGANRIKTLFVNNIVIATGDAEFASNNIEPIFTSNFIGSNFDDNNIGGFFLLIMICSKLIFKVQLIRL